MTIFVYGYATTGLKAEIVDSKLLLVYVRTVISVDVNQNCLSMVVSAVSMYTKSKKKSVWYRGYLSRVCNMCIVHEVCSHTRYVREELQMLPGITSHFGSCMNNTATECDRGYKM